MKRPKLWSEREWVDIFRDVAAGVMFLSVAFCAYKVVKILDLLTPKAVMAIEHVDRAAALTGYTLKNIEQATRDLSAQEQAEVKSITLISGKTATAIDSANTAVGTLNTTLGSVNTMVLDQNRKMTEALDGAKVAFADLHTVMGKTGAAIDTIPVTMHKVDASLELVPPVLKNADVTMKNVADATGDIRDVTKKYRDDLLKPVKKVQAAAKIVGNYAVEFAAYFFGAKKW